MKFSRCVYLTIAILFAKTSVAFGQDAPAISGPMVGHTTESSAIIWMYAPKASKLEIDFSEATEANPKATMIFDSVVNPAGDLSGAPYKVTLRDLRPLTSYKYQQTDDDVTITDIDNNITRIPREDIEEIKAQNKSLMPDTLLNGLSNNENIYRVADNKLTGSSYDLTFDGQGNLLVADGNAVRRLKDVNGDQVYDSF